MGGVNLTPPLKASWAKKVKTNHSDDVTAWALISYTFISNLQVHIVDYLY